MRADPLLAAHTAGTMLDVATALTDLAGSLPSTLDLDLAAFGDLPASAEAATAYRDCADALVALVSQVGQVLEGDCDRLYQLAFGLRAVEHRVSARLSATTVTHAIAAAP